MSLVIKLRQDVHINGELYPADVELEVPNSFPFLNLAEVVHPEKPLEVTGLDVSGKLKVLTPGDGTETKKDHEENEDAEE